MTTIRTTPSPASSLAPQHRLAQFPTYAGAEKLVDTLSDKGFPVEHTRIVGTGLHTVEYVTGRLTSWLALQAGAASGAWFGLFVGLLLGIFSNDDRWFGVVLAASIIGAVWGATFGWFAHRVTHGRRDFNSVQRLEADDYAVFVDSDRADDATRLAGLL